jgi:hypothetical protein
MTHIIFRIHYRNYDSKIKLICFYIGSQPIAVEQTVVVCYIAVRFKQNSGQPDKLTILIGNIIAM